MSQLFVFLIYFCLGQLLAQTSPTYRNDLDSSKAIQSKQMQEAELAEKNKDFDKVIEVLKPQTDTLSRKGLMILGRAYKAKELFLDEQRVLALITNRDAKDYVALTLLGQSYARLKKSADAAKSFRKAINLKKSYKPAYEGLISQAREKNNKYDVRTLLEEALANLGPESFLLNQLCASYAQDTFIEKAFSTCADAIRKDPQMASNHVYLGLAHLDAKDKPTARKILLKAAEQFTTSAFAQCAAGEVLRSDDDWVAAAGFFERGTQAEANNIQCWIGLGETQLENKKYDAAYTALEKACALNRQKSLPLIKKVSGKFRLEKNDEWYERFQQLANKC